MCATLAGDTGMKSQPTGSWAPLLQGVQIRSQQRLCTQLGISMYMQDQAWSARSDTGGVARRGGEPEAAFAKHLTQNEHQWVSFKTGEVD